MAKKLGANSVQNTPYPSSNDFRRREIKLQKEFEKLSKQGEGRLQFEESRRSQYRSQERHGPNSKIGQSDSDSDDMMDLAVL